MQIGVIERFRADRPLFQKARGYGLRLCQLSPGNEGQCTEETAERVCLASAEAGVRVCSVIGRGPGATVWNFTDGPSTIGLVPPEYRAARVEALKKIAAFAGRIGAKALVSHCGFIPENPKDPLYEGTREAVREVTECCAAHGLEFRFETGQETPVVLLRLIEDIGASNLFINLDPANLILYGKANPIDALDIIGPYVHSLHVKDGFYPTDGRRLGKEARVGEGRVDFPRFMARLKEIGFDGELIVEREIKEGEDKDRDIRETIERLKSWGGVV